MKNNIIYLFISLFLFAACGEEELTPSEPQEFYEFPQGDAEYDQEILAFYEEYGTQFLYEFWESDFRWNVTDYIPYYAEQGDTAYVSEAFDFVTEECFSIWEDDFLRQLLPVHVLLASEVYLPTEEYEYTWSDENQSWGYEWVYDTLICPTAYGLNHVTFGYTNEQITGLTSEEKLDLIGDMAKSLIAYAASRDKIEIPEDFSELFTTDWNTEDLATYTGDYGYNASGFLEYFEDIDVNYDFGLYVKYLVTMSEEDFKAWALDESFDCNGEWSNSANAYVRSELILQKYEAVIDYFQNTLGIDLHSIGYQVSTLYQ